MTPARISRTWECRAGARKVPRAKSPEFPPTVAISASQLGGASLVTITAMDDTSGMKATYYSLDGAHFQTYSAPFTVDPRAVFFVYAFADDNVANQCGRAYSYDRR